MPYSSQERAIASHCHSPVLLATPAAQLYELAEDGVSSPVYDDLQAVRQMRGSLEAPERYLRQIVVGSDED